MEFVTRKITYAVAAISQKIKNTKALNEQKEPLVKDGKLKLGNLDASRDWGFAGDYVKGMWQMLQQEVPKDYVIATGRSATIRDFLNIAFNCIGISDWEEYVEIDPRFKRPSELKHLRGNAELAQKELGWKATTTLEDLVKMMVESDQQRVKRYEFT
jgi:GDPmannose 4,6-dehydratase